MKDYALYVFYLVYKVSTKERNKYFIQATVENIKVFFDYQYVSYKNALGASGIQKNILQTKITR